MLTRERRACIHAMYLPILARATQKGNTSVHGKNRVFLLFFFSFLFPFSSFCFTFYLCINFFPFHFLFMLFYFLFYFFYFPPECALLPGF